MERIFGTAKLSIVTGDLTNSPDLDLIVNAANEQLRGGGGVCGFIFKAAGWKGMQYACNGHLADISGVRCPTGESISTPAGELPNKGVVHSVGPRFNQQLEDDCLDDSYMNQMRDELDAAYTSALDEAARLGFASIGFPAISCGIFKYPTDVAAEVAATACRAWMIANSGSTVQEVRLVFIPFADGPALQDLAEAAVLALPSEPHTVVNAPISNDLVDAALLQAGIVPASMQDGSGGIIQSCDD